jgi:hypothetical protein
MKRFPTPGVVVSVLVTGPKIHGFKPEQGNGLLRTIRSHSTQPFGGEVKLEAPFCKILWHEKITCKYEQKYFKVKLSHSFHQFLPLATRWLCW